MMMVAQEEIKPVELELMAISFIQFSFSVCACDWKKKTKTKTKTNNVTTSRAITRTHAIIVEFLRVRSSRSYFPIHCLLLYCNFLRRESLPLSSS